MASPFRCQLWTTVRSPRSQTLYLLPKRLFSITLRTGSECACSLPASPIIPESHPVDTETPLANTSAQYHTHLLLSTGTSDWSSKIDLDPSLHGTVISTLRAAIKKRESDLLVSGDSSIAERRVILGMSSFPPPKAKTDKKDQASVIIYPQGNRIDFLTSGPSYSESIARIAELALAPREIAASAKDTIRTKGITILLCSHGGRDVRCGILGPYLQECIRAVLDEKDGLGAAFVAMDEPPLDTDPQEARDHRIPVTVGCTSHIGGHKWAGNMIVYFPKSDERKAQSTDGLPHHPEHGQAERLKGVWYGRINRDNVEEVLRKTLLGYVQGLEDSIVAKPWCRRVVY